MQRRVSYAIAALLLVGLVGLALTSCSPAAADLQIMVRDQAGLPIAGITVDVDGETIVTGPNGEATFTDLTPGTITISLAGPGYVPLEWDMVLESGDNQFVQTMTAEPLAVVSLDTLSSWRIRLETGTDDEVHTVEATLVAHHGAHWDFGDAELVEVPGAVYLADDQVLGFKHYEPSLAEYVDPVRLYLGLAASRLKEVELFHDWVVDEDVLARPAGYGEVNGYDCRIYRVSWVHGQATLAYDVWVVDDGSHAGRITRYETIVPEGSATLTVDLYDFDEPMLITLPLG